MRYPLRCVAWNEKTLKNTIFHLFKNLFFQPIFERIFRVHFCVCPKNFLLIDRILIGSKKQKKFFIFAGFWTKTLFRVYFWGHVKNAIFWNGGQNFPLKFVNDGVEIFFYDFFNFYFLLEIFLKNGKNDQKFILGGLFSDLSIFLRAFFFPFSKCPLKRMVFSFQSTKKRLKKRENNILKVLKRYFSAHFKIEILYIG